MPAPSRCARQNPSADPARQPAPTTAGSPTTAVSGPVRSTDSPPSSTTSFVVEGMRRLDQEQG